MQTVTKKSAFKQKTLSRNHKNEQTYSKLFKNLRVGYKERNRNYKTKYKVHKETHCSILCNHKEGITT